MAGKGVIVEFDFAVLNGADILFETASRYLEKLDNIKLDAIAEARYLAGGNYQGAIAELFAAVKTKKTAPKAARELAAEFQAKLDAAVPGAITTGFRNFVKTLSDKGVKVVISTRANLEKVGEAFKPMLGENVCLHQELSQCYGAVKWDSWRKACAANQLHYLSVLAITGSGLGVKSALMAGLGSVAVINDRVAYQDFTGADEVVKELSVQVARRVLEILRIS